MRIFVKFINKCNLFKYHVSKEAVDWWNSCDQPMDEYVFSVLPLQTAFVVIFARVKMRASRFALPENDFALP